jgi:hypothetical protein
MSNDKSPDAVQQKELMFKLYNSGLSYSAYKLISQKKLFTVHEPQLFYQ